MSDEPVVDDEASSVRFLPDGRPLATRRVKHKGTGHPNQGSGSSPLSDAHLELKPGDRLIVVGNLRLGPHPDEATSTMTRDLARVIESATGRTHCIFIGDLDDSAVDGRVDATPMLNAHQRLADAVAGLGAEPGCSVSICPRGRSDAATLRPGEADVAKRLNATFERSVEVTVESGRGTARFTVGPDGDAPMSPAPPHQVTAPGHAADVGWLEGVDELIDPTEVGAFTASRFFYRRVAKWLGWSLLPLVAAWVTLLAGVGVQLVARNRPVTSALYRVTAYLALGGVALIAAVSLGALILHRRSTHGTTRVDADPLHDPDDPAAVNDPSRDRAGRLVREGQVGLVTGDTAQPELSSLGRGFFANAGRCGTVSVRRPGRFGLPDAWVTEQQWSWLEIESASELRVRLHFGRRQRLSTTFAERLGSRPTPATDRPDRTVAEWPGGQDWPAPPREAMSRRNVRRLAAALIAVAGVVNLVSAVLPPIRARIDAVDDVVPIVASQAAASVVVLLGLALLLVGRGIRRGQRHAWVVALVVLVTSAILHVVKGLDLEEALISIGVAGYLVAHRGHFRVRADDVSVGKGLLILGGGALAAVLTAVLAIQLVPQRVQPNLSWPRAFEAAVERLVGVRSVPLAPHLDGFLTPVMVAVTCGLVICAGWLAFSPMLARRGGVPDGDDERRARQIVTSADGGTLSYFALRDDKQWFFSGDTVVAFAIIRGIALVSPDPIGPVAERRRAWKAFTAFADEHGWPVMVMGASQDWLSIYRSAGMHDLYVGDEAVVDARRFTLDGPRNKAIRQAVNRVENKGYTIEFHDPLDLDGTTEAALRALMSQSRRGDVERGFSMTLGRVFDRRDRGLLLAICRDPAGVPAAFCQYVPAPAIDGYSLDLMRRSEEGAHPNGLTDYVLAKTILHLRDTGRTGLGLNFATMRATLAGERGDGTVRRVERWFYRKMSDTMQIESLWRYNAKFDPDWVPRYACYESVEHVPASAMALATAESWWEIPVIGRLFMPPPTDVPVEADIPA